MKLAIVQIALGALITAAAVFIFGWGFPDPYTVPLPDGTEMHIFVTPATRVVIIEGATVLLGLAVLGVGIAQLLKAKGLKGAKPL